MVLMSPDAELDLNMCELIIDIMSERIKVCNDLLVWYVFIIYQSTLIRFYVQQDKSPLVRVQAILAVYRLQDSSDANCPVTKSKLRIENIFDF